MHEHLDDFGLINMNGRVFDPLTAQFLSPDNYIQADGNWLNYNRYAYCLNNPLKYTDPSGDFITWSISNKGFSIGFNFSPLGIPIGAGVNIGWIEGGSIGIYGEIGYRVGGTGFGSGITVSQSLDYSFSGKGWSTSTNVGVYASIAFINVGGNYSYDYTSKKSSWGVNAGINVFGCDTGGVGLSIGYGSDGWTYGLGGFINPYAWRDNPVYEPERWNDDVLDKLENNCYNYALDDLKDSFTQPGDIAGEPIQYTWDINMDEILQASLNDGSVRKPGFWDKFGFGQYGYYRVYLVIDTGFDYHWYRQDKGGGWSHKPGATSVINTDASGMLIYNPAKANHNYGFFRNYSDKGIMLWAKRRR